MPPTFLLVLGVMLLALAGPVLAAGLLTVSLFPSRRDAARPALRWGLTGVVAGLAVGALLSLVGDRGTSMMDGIIIASSAGFTLGVIARAVRSFAVQSASHPPRVEVRADGFSESLRGKPIASVAWEQVERITAYKRDNDTADNIMLGFAYAGPPGRTMQLEVSEEWPGSQDLFGAIEERFPGLPPERHTRVTLLAFEPNDTVLYERTPAHPHRELR